MCIFIKNELPARFLPIRYSLRNHCRQQADLLSKDEEKFIIKLRKEKKMRKKKKNKSKKISGNTTQNNKRTNSDSLQFVL